MTENEAKIFIQNAMEQSKKALAELLLISPKVFAVRKKSLGEYYSNLENCKKEIESCEVAVQALEDVQKYRAIEKDLKERYHANVDIPLLMHHFIETVFEGEKHEGFCLLTNEDAKVWEEYKAIGTPEELQEMKKDFAEALSDWRQYRKVGTLEECRAAVEKQTAKKVKSISKVKDGDSYVGLIGRCPCCGDILEEDTVYCDCGQKLDWSDEE
jgi:hypothetical protein